ncbi:MAG: BrnT family toxin [Hyphomonadaceae bacterium]
MPKPPPGFEWDDAKAAWNLRVHSISFAEVREFQFETALGIEGSDYDSEEVRLTRIGKIKRRTYVLVYTRRAGRIRVISLRRATAQERRAYIEAKDY